MDAPTGALSPPAAATACASLRRGAQVRNLYKRVLLAGRDYPLGLDYVRQKAKAEFAKRAHIRDDVEARAIPSARRTEAPWHAPTVPPSSRHGARLHRADPRVRARRACSQLKRAVHYGRYMVKEMIGVIGLKKYRTLKARYSDGPR